MIFIFSRYESGLNHAFGCGLRGLTFPALMKYWKRGLENKHLRLIRDGPHHDKHISDFFFIETQMLHKAAAVLSKAADCYLLGGVGSRCFCLFAPVSSALIETSIHSRSLCARLLCSEAWVELIDLWKRGCMCLLLFQLISGCVTRDVSWSLLKKVPITSGLIPHHFALARRQSAKC